MENTRFNIDEACIANIGTNLRKYPQVLIPELMVIET